MNTKYVVIIQCNLAKNRCSSMRCTNAFYEKTDAFKNYNKDTKYISFTCGGCSGKVVSSKLTNFSRWLKKLTILKKMKLKYIFHPVCRQITPITIAAQISTIYSIL